jgi:Flp pilus assembly protein TadG
MALNLLKRVASGWRDERGQSILEAAIVTPLLVLLTFGIMEFAIVFYQYLALENGVSQATRYAITGNQMNDPGNPGNLLSATQSIETAMRQATPTLTLPDGDFTFSHMTPGSTTWTAGTGNPNDIEKVAINYTWTIMTPIMRQFFPGGQITLRVESAMKNEPRFN